MLINNILKYLKVINLIINIGLKYELKKSINSKKKLNHNIIFNIEPY